MTGSNKKKGQKPSGARRMPTQAAPVDPVVTEAEQARRRSLALFAELLKEQPSAGTADSSTGDVQNGRPSAAQSTNSPGQQTGAQGGDPVDTGASNLMLEEVRTQIELSCTESLGVSCWTCLIVSHVLTTLRVFECGSWVSAGWTSR